MPPRVRRPRPPARSPSHLPAPPRVDLPPGASCLYEAPPRKGRRPRRALTSPPPHTLLRREDLQDQVRAVPRRRARRRPQAGARSSEPRGERESFDPPGPGNPRPRKTLDARSDRSRSARRSRLTRGSSPPLHHTPRARPSPLRALTSAVSSGASPERPRASRTPPRTRTRASSGARRRCTITSSTRRSTSPARRWSSRALRNPRTAPISSPTSRRAPSEREGARGVGDGSFNRV